MGRVTKYNICYNWNKNAKDVSSNEIPNAMSYISQVVTKRS
jgi:hypothetical protein